jgi:hypothetical protein
LQVIPVKNGSEEFNIKLELQAQGIYLAVLSNGRKNYMGKVMFE